MLRVVQIEQRYTPLGEEEEKFEDFLNRVQTEIEKFGDQAHFLTEPGETYALWVVAVQALDGLDAVIHAAKTLRTALMSARMERYSWTFTTDLTKAREVDAAGAGF
ncbi:MAG: hypothetical protein SPI77_08055 [Corynebacterium sp.]|nr:hypothetical protein [Corynebacterium sp.]